MPTTLTTPLTEAAVRHLQVGDAVLLSGTLFTARDAVHRALASGETPPCTLDHAVVYHCGPVVVEVAGRHQVMAAGPTTSAREEPYMSTLIERFHLHAVIGKGGMGEATQAACRQFGCVYLHAVGGAAQVLAARVAKVANVFWAERFGSPEAIWELQVQDFPALVTIDCRGDSLHRQVADTAARRLAPLLASRP